MVARMCVILLYGQKQGRAASGQREVRPLDRDRGAGVARHYAPGGSLQMRLRDGACCPGPVTTTYRQGPTELRMLAARAVSSAGRQAVDDAWSEQAPALPALEADQPALPRPERAQLPLVRRERRGGLGRLATRCCCFYRVCGARAGSAPVSEALARQVSTRRQLRTWQNPLGYMADAGTESPLALTGGHDGC